MELRPVARGSSFLLAVVLLRREAAVPRPGAAAEDLEGAVSLCQPDGRAGQSVCGVA